MYVESGAQAPWSHRTSPRGSAGCIDLTTSIADFVSDLDREGARKKCQIPLTVTYPETAR